MTDVDEEVRCALWFWRFKIPNYVLCGSEKEAIDLAIGMEDDGDGSVSGIQFSDGRLIEKKDWTALYIAQERHDLEQDEYLANRPQPRPTRKINDPFKPYDVVWAEVDDPPWLGRE